MHRRWLSGCIAALLAASCGGDVGVDDAAEPGRDAGMERVEPVDAKLEAHLDVQHEAPVQEPFDWCSEPDPGACCCEQLNLLVTIQADAGPDSCRFSLPEGPQYRSWMLNVEVVTTPPEYLLGVTGPEQCLTGGYYVIPSDPAEIVICPMTCEALHANGLTMLRVLQGCYSIACPPP